jgi:hypothetical protein
MDADVFALRLIPVVHIPNESMLDKSENAKTSSIQ